MLKTGIGASGRYPVIPGVASDGISSLAIEIEGISEDAEREAQTEGCVMGVTKGAQFDPSENRITVYAGNISYLDNPNDPDLLGRRIARIDRALRLALGRFAHSIFHDGGSSDIEEVMISQYDRARSDIDWVTKYTETPAVSFARQELVSDIWPAFTAYPLASVGVFAAWTLVARRQREVSNLEHVRCSDMAAYYFEIATRESPALSIHTKQ